MRLSALAWIVERKSTHAEQCCAVLCEHDDLDSGVVANARVVVRRKRELREADFRVWVGIVRGADDANLGHNWKRHIWGHISFTQVDVQTGIVVA